MVKKTSACSTEPTAVMPHTLQPIRTTAPAPVAAASNLPRDSRIRSRLYLSATPEFAINVRDASTSTFDKTPPRLRPA